LVGIRYTQRDFEDGKLSEAWDKVNCRKGQVATDQLDPVAVEMNEAIYRGKRSARVQRLLWLEPAGYSRACGGTTRTVWYDDVVVAIQYIGQKVD